MTPVIERACYFLINYSCLSFRRSCQFVIDAKNSYLVLCFSTFLGESFSSTSLIALIVYDSIFFLGLYIVLEFFLS